MWGRPVNFITFFVICPGQGRATRIARFIRGREGWARSGQSSRQWDARIGTRRGRKRGRRGSGTREFIRGQDRCADMCSDLKSEMKIRRFESRKFIRGEDRSGRGRMHLCYPLLPTRIFEERRARKGSTQNRYFYIFSRNLSVEYSYGAGRDGHIHTGQGRTGPLWTPIYNILVNFFSVFTFFISFFLRFFY